jgi:hypothetical protein
MTWTGLQPTSVPLRTRTEMVLETLVLSTFNHLTLLVARENFIISYIIFRRKALMRQISTWNCKSSRRGWMTEELILEWLNMVRTRWLGALLRECTLLVLDSFHRQMTGWIKAKVNKDFVLM